jgi:hypothetical protein
MPGDSREFLQKNNCHEKKNERCNKVHDHERPDKWLELFFQDMCHKLFLTDQYSGKHGIDKKSHNTEYL